MYRLAYFMLGFLTYGLLELAAVAIICRYFPRYIGRLQRLGDSLYQTFRKDPPADEPEGGEEEEDECCTAPSVPATTTITQDRQWCTRTPALTATGR